MSKAAVTIDDTDPIATSFPSFFDLIATLRGEAG
jgi:5-enolpyruvylshikimate-3-phosphate synthase